ncbi:T9SS type A sorting domain-containing protein [Flavobacterium sp. SM2513]|uniref:T9SS type A sorting domain-containing protein n=1 Tax=Flavobacterium sp. SM2513 TaxID=3424766 RepID=UPI003D7F9E74
MKKITLLFILLTFSFGYSQDLLLGFETGESGGIVAEPFGGAPAPTIEAGTGTNTTQVLKMVGNPTGEPWQGTNLNLTSLVNLSNTQTMTMDVFSDSPITFLVKVTGGVGGPAQVAAAASHTGGSTWQTISFTFNTSLDGQAALANGTYSGFVIHTYWAPGAVAFFNPTVPTPERTFYIDNIKGPLGAEPVFAAPTTAAPTPPARAASDVRSIFSNAYAPISTIGYSGDVDSFNTTWSPASTTLVSVVGNDTNKVTGLGFEGVAFQAGRFDATNFTHFHIDFWTETATLDKSFNVKFSNWNNGTQEANAIELSITNSNFLTNPNPGTWYSIDVPLSAFAPVNGANRNDLVQFIITSDLGTVYYDNLYLHKNTVLGTNNFVKSSFKMYPNPAKGLLNVSSDFSFDNISIHNTLGQLVATQKSGNNKESIDVSNLPNGVYILSAQVGNEVIKKQFIKE